MLLIQWVDKMTVKRRRSKIPKMEVIELYTKGQTEEQIAESLGSSKGTVSKIIVRHIQEMTNLRESRLLITAQKKTIKGSTAMSGAVNRGLQTILNTKTINKDFTEMLSKPDAAELSVAETHFVFVYSLTGDGVTALEEAGLAAGLQQPNTGDRNNYGTCLQIRAEYMKKKSNVSMAIQLERTRNFGEVITKGIDRKYIQGELLEQLDQMKHTPKLNRKDILACLKMIGETVGAYVKNIQISEIDPAESMEELIEMVKDREDDSGEVYEVAGK